MFALRQGKPICVMCDDKCFAVSKPRTEHVGRSKSVALATEGTPFREPFESLPMRLFAFLLRAAF